MKRLFLTVALVFTFVFSAVPSATAFVGSQLAQAPIIKVKEGTSTNWSGYAVETNLSSPQKKVVTDVKGQWTVPTLTCTSASTYSSAWVGIDGYSSGTVEQTGTEHDCINGVATYSAWYEMYPHFPVTIMKVNPGDTIYAEVKYVSNQFVLTLNDLKTGATFSTSQKMSQAQRSSAEWIVEAPWSSGVLPLANFGTISFTNASATINGHTGSINDSAWQYDPITMVNSSGTPKDQLLGLSSDGTSFSIKWLASN